MPASATNCAAPRRPSSRGRLPSGKPNPIDVHVGGRVRLRRTLLGLSQEKLAEALGLTFQQVQKYERGTNRIGCSRLFDLARALDVSISFFYDDMTDEVAASSPAAIVRGIPAAVAPSAGADPLARRESLELIRAYYSIRDPKVRAQVYALAKSLAAEGEPGSPVAPAAAE